MIYGIIVAAGSGVRLGLQVMKFEAELLGKPLIYYALAAFERAERVDATIVVIPESGAVKWTTGFLQGEGFGKVRRVVAGGATRQASVYAGLMAVENPAEADIAVIHDGARPLVSPRLIDAVCEIPAGFDGVIPVCPVTDTVKRVEGNEVVKTLDRRGLVYVQTPQAFVFQRLLDAHERAREAGFEATDDSALVEEAGGRIVALEGLRSNIKVTYPEDLRFAELLMACGVEK